MRAIAFDFETTKIPHFHPWDAKAYPVMLSVVDDTGYRKSWVFNHNELHNNGDDPCLQADNIKEIQEEIDRSDVLVGQNAKFDINWLRKLRVKFEHKEVYCTKNADYIINGHKKVGYHLNDIAERWGVDMKFDQVKMYWESGYETSEIPLSILIPYCEKDCANTLEIYKKQLPVIERENLQKPVQLANKLSVLLSEIECNGILSDKELGMKLVADIQQQLDLLDLGLKKLLGDINFNSGDELSAALFGGVIKRDGKETVQKQLKSGQVKEYERKCIIETRVDGAGFKPIKNSETKKDGYYQVNKSILEQIGAKTKVQKEIKDGLLARSAVAKSLESLWGEKDDAGILNKVQADGCIHPQYNQTVTSTGRLSSSDPNGQNLPREGTSPIKRIFIPRFDFVSSADLAQLEWRVAALLSQDPVMIQEILSGADIHADNATNFFGDIEYRKTAKFMTFRLIYGGTAYGFFMDYKMPRFPLKKWEKIVDEFYAKYKRLKEWQTENIRMVQETGRLYIPSGRFFAFNKQKGDYSVRQIKNYPVQGFSFDIMALAMLVIKKRLNDIISKMIAQVHDEVVFDTVKGEFRRIGKTCIEVFEALPKYMKQYWGFDCNVPFTGDMEAGPNYEEMKQIDRGYFFK